jgi:protein O-mannosyl-transferase
MSENKPNFFQSNGELFVLIGLVLICVVIYAQTVGFDFINFDDNFYVYENTVVLGGLSWSSVKWALTAFHAANWHPLTWISHMLDVRLFGAGAGAHHATNVILHVVNSFLAFIVFRKMTGCFWKSAVVAALFAAHPAHVESVAWISERKDVLSTMFWLLTMLAYFRYAEIKVESSRFKAPYYILTIVLFALGLMSKPMLVTLPFVLLLCDYWALERLKILKDLKPLVAEKLPLFVLSAVSAYITVIAQRSFGAVQTLEALSLPTRLLNALVACAKYVAMLFYPVDLGVGYAYRETFPAWQILGSIVLLGGISAFCIWQRKERKYLLMGWLWFLGTLVPVIGIVQVGAQSMADRYTYVPYFGLFVMLVWGAWEIFLRLKLDLKILAAIVSVVLIALVVLSFKQASYWQNSETLYAHTLAAGDGNFIVKNNLCNYLMRKNRPAEAESHCVDAVAENPNFIDTFITLGVIDVKLNKLEDAVANFRKALAIDANEPVIYTNLAAPLAMLGRTDESAEAIEKAAALYKKSGANPALLNDAYNSLAAAYAEQKKFDKSAEILERMLQNSPENWQIRANYAMTLYYQDKPDEAQKQIEQALKIAPNQAESHNLYGLILLKLNKRDEAGTEFKRALQLKPNFPEAKENLGKIAGEK